MLDGRFPLIELQSGRVLFPFRWASLSQTGQNRWNVSAVEYGDIHFYSTGDLIVPGPNPVSLWIVVSRRIAEMQSRRLSEYARWIARECEAECREPPMDPFPIIDIRFIGYIDNDDTDVKMFPVRIATATSAASWDVTNIEMEELDWPAVNPPAFIFNDVAPTNLLTFRQQQNP